jgi:starvation-inducible DNA-binding protein
MENRRSRPTAPTVTGLPGATHPSFSILHLHNVTRYVRWHLRRAQPISIVCKGPTARAYDYPAGAKVHIIGGQDQMSPKNEKEKAKYNQLEAGTERARPIQHQHAYEIQPYGKIAKLPIALDEKVCAASVENLNQVLADTMTLRDLYKKHHWQVAGHTFYQLHLLFDKHHGEQDELVDDIAERIQLLGGVSIAMAADVAETTLISRPPRGREQVPEQISRLLEAHEIILKEARTMAKQAAAADDDGTNDLLVSQVIRTNELQVWFLAEHLVDVPVVRAEQSKAVAAG